MIGWGAPPNEPEESAPRSFDDFDLRLGDVMRGERATLGKSLLDVQRELKIKATYIAAIENADVSAFSSPGFIAGYVRSYARYLGLDPEWAFDTFCHEADFAPAAGLTRQGSAEAGARAPGKARTKGPVFRSKPGAVPEAERDPIAEPRFAFTPPEKGPFSGVEPRAVGSTLVLLALIGAIGYGGWAVLKEVQRVSVAPVDRAPEAVAQVDPLEGVRFPAEEGTEALDTVAGGVGMAPPDALERLYRPQPLDAPVMVARDGPIAAINPGQVGALADLGLSTAPYAGPGAGSGAGPGTGAPGSAAPGWAGPNGAGLGVAGLGGAGETDQIGAAIGQALAGVPGGIGPDRDPAQAGPRVTADVPEVLLVAVRPAWVRVRAADGSVLFERTLEPGDTWVVPPTEAPPTLRTGAAGAVYFAVNGQTYGPAGPNGAVVDGIALNSGALQQDFALVDPAASEAAREAVAVAEAALSTPEAAPQPETPPAE